MAVGSLYASLNSGALFSCGFLPLVLCSKHMIESTRSFTADPDYVAINFSVGSFQVLDTVGDTLEVRFGEMAHKQAHKHLAPACTDYLHALLNDDEAVGFHLWQLEALHKALGTSLSRHAEQRKLVTEVAA